MCVFELVELSKADYVVLLGWITRSKEESAKAIAQIHKEIIICRRLVATLPAWECVGRLQSFVNPRCRIKMDLSKSRQCRDRLAMYNARHQ